VLNSPLLPLVIASPPHGESMKYRRYHWGIQDSMLGGHIPLPSLPSLLLFPSVRRNSVLEELRVKRLKPSPKTLTLLLALI